jgi:hypothetical protein
MSETRTAVPWRAGRLCLPTLILALACERAPAPVYDAPAPGPDAALRLAYRFVPVRTIESLPQGAAGLAVRTDGVLLVAAADGVHVLDSTGGRLAHWPTDGPARALVATAEQVLVGLEDRVVVFSPEGEHLAEWGGAQDSEPGRLRLVTGMAVDDGSVFVADAGNRCVQRFALDGDFIQEIGRRDPGQGVPGILLPSPYLDCCVDDQGRLWVSNPGRHRLEAYAVDGRLITAVGGPGNGVGRFCGCCNPTNLAWFATAEALVTAEKGLPRLQILDARDGTCLAYAGSELLGPDERGMDLAFAGNGELCVLLPVSRRIAVFEIEKGMP